MDMVFRLDWPGFRRAAVNGFICLNLIAVGSWLAPDTWLLRYRVVQLFEPYLAFFHLHQAWTMFCPVVPMVNYYIGATVRMADGSLRTWTFPRMQQYNLFERYEKERYRKWVENLCQEPNELLRADAAYYVARRFNTPGNPPVEVWLTEYWADIPAPQDGPRQALPSHYQSAVIFRSTLGPEVLK
jgi:hypothetical protein